MLRRMARLLVPVLVVAPPAARKGPLSEDQARAIVGGAFFLLSAWYVATTIGRMVKAARD